MTEKGREVSSASLHAAPGSPLDDPRTRETVLAAVRAIAERTGVTVVAVDVIGEQLEVQVEGPEILVVGLLAELRRSTDHWHRQRHQGGLWISPPGVDE